MDQIENTLDGGAKIEPKIPVEEEGGSFEPNSSETKEGGGDPTFLFPSIILYTQNQPSPLLSC